MKEKGITLIALIITIIIMLILSTVVINLTIGKNGIFSMAKDAVKQQKMAETREEIAMAILDIQAQKAIKNEDFSIDVIVDELPNKIIDITIQKDGGEAKGICNGFNYKIDKEYNVIIEGLIENKGENSQEEDNKKVLVSKIILDKETQQVEIGKTVTVPVTIQPNNATNKNIIWSSSDDSIATVDENGVVTGVKAGTITVTATAADGSGISSTYNVTVNNPVPVSLANMVNVGDYVAYDPTVGVSSANQSKLTYKSPVGTGTSHGNGNSDITFTALANDGTDEGMKWRVLSKDISTGEVILINDRPQQYMTLKGAIGYLYAEQELNEACAIYGYGLGADTSKTMSYKTGYTIDGVTTGRIIGTGARSLSEEDLLNMTGYIPKANQDDYYKYGNSYTVNIYYPTHKTTTGYSSSNITKAIKRTVYNVTEVTESISTESPEYDLIYNFTHPIFNAKEKYFVSGRTEASYGDEYSGGVNFQVMYHHYNNGLGIANLFHSYNSGNNSFYDYRSSIRPIVYLKPSIKTIGKNADGAWTIVE